MELCKYKHIFGVEKEGIHSYRLFNVAIVDVLSTVIGAIFIALLFNTNAIVVFIVLMVLSLILHRLFCVKTTLTKAVFGDKF